jgi:hypothetical protein
MHHYEPTQRFSPEISSRAWPKFLVQRLDHAVIEYVPANWRPRRHAPFQTPAQRSTSGSTTPQPARPPLESRASCRCRAARSTGPRAVQSSLARPLSLPWCLHRAMNNYCECTWYKLDACKTVPAANIWLRCSSTATPTVSQDKKTRRSVHKKRSKQKAPGMWYGRAPRNDHTQTCAEPAQSVNTQPRHQPRATTGGCVLAAPLGPAVCSGTPCNAFQVPMAPSCCQTDTSGPHANAAAQRCSSSAPAVMTGLVVGSVVSCLCNGVAMEEGTEGLLISRQVARAPNSLAGPLACT